jgi:hypothetical protein
MSIKATQPEDIAVLIEALDAVTRARRSYGEVGTRDIDIKAHNEKMNRARAAIFDLMNVAVPAHASAAAKRVQAFVDEYATRRGLHPDWIYSLGMGEDELRLTISDLRAILALATPSPQPAEEPTDAMVQAYLDAQRAAVEEADKFGRPNVGGLHTNTVREACRAGLRAAIAAQAEPAEAKTAAVDGMTDAKRYQFARSYGGRRVALFTIDDEGKPLDILVGGFADSEIDAAIATQEGGR